MGEKSFDHLLERCLQEVEDTGDIDVVLRRHPEHAEQLRPLLQLASTMRERYAEVPEPQAQLAVGRARLRREARQARRAAAAEQVAATRQEGRSSMRLRLVPTLVSIAVVVAVWMAGMAGVALAADASGPGEPLYSLDRTMEQIQLRLTYDPEAATQLRMRLTQERMDEIQGLVRKQDQERLEKALGDYGDAVGELALRSQAREQLADPARIAEMDQILARNEEQMRYAFQMGEDEDDLDDPQDPEEPDDDDDKGGRNGNGWYTNTTTVTHPVALSLAREYNISATQVVSWFADGYGFGEIMHALKTSEAISGTETTISDTSPTGLLELKTELGGWGQVWQAAGLIGGGRPDHSMGSKDGDEPKLKDKDQDQDHDQDRDRDQDRDKDQDKDKEKDKGKDTAPGQNRDDKGKDTAPGQNRDDKGRETAPGQNKDDNGSSNSAGPGEGESQSGNGGK
jgi:hypothetical protein